MFIYMSVISAAMFWRGKRSVTAYTIRNQLTPSINYNISVVQPRCVKSRWRTDSYQLNPWQINLYNYGQDVWPCTAKVCHRQIGNLRDTRVRTNWILGRSSFTIMDRMFDLAQWRCATSRQVIYVTHGFVPTESLADQPLQVWTNCLNLYSFRIWKWINLKDLWNFFSYQEWLTGTSVF